MTLMLTVALPATVGAQEYWTQRRHSLEFTAGAFPHTFNQETFNGLFGSYWDRHSDYWNLQDSFYGSDRTYEGPLRTSGAMSLTYKFRPLRRLSIDASATYTGFYRQEFYIRDNSRAANISRHYLYVQVGFSAIWLDRPMVEMYSGLEMGIGTVFTKDRYMEENLFPGFQVNLVGIRIGKNKWYGKAELGYGTKGILNAGVGRRF